MIDETCISTNGVTFLWSRGTPLHIAQLDLDLGCENAGPSSYNRISFHHAEEGPLCVDPHRILGYSHQRPFPCDVYHGLPSEPLPRSDAQIHTEGPGRHLRQHGGVHPGRHAGGTFQESAVPSLGRGGGELPF